MSRPDPFIKRPLVAITISYIGGIIMGRLWLGGFQDFFCLAGFLFVLVLGLTIRKVIPAYMATVLLVIAATGTYIFVFYSEPAPGGLLEFTGTPVYVEGFIVEEPLHYEDHSAYRLKVEAVETKEGPFKITGILLAKVYGTEGDSYLFGEHLRLRGTIVEPSGERNPGGFDYRLHLRSTGVDALIYPNPAQVKVLGIGETGLLRSSTVALRSSMAEGIEENLPSPTAELLKAMLFGQRHQLPENIEDNFRRAGAGHLMAVSGLHVGLVAAMILGICRRLGFKGHLPLLVAIIIVFGFAYLTGLRPASLRAALMLSLALGALLLDREKDLPSAVSLAALITLIYNPLLLFTVGFQLSYAATLSIIYLVRPLGTALRRLRLPGYLTTLAAVTLAAQIGVLPISAYHFHHIPLGGIFFNLILLPMMAPLLGLGLTGGLIYGLAPGLAAPLLWGCRPLLELMLLLCKGGELPWIYKSVYPPGLPGLILYYAILSGGAALYYHCRVKGKEVILIKLNSLSGKVIDKGPIISFRSIKTMVALVLILGIFLFWIPLLIPESANLKVTFIDVGQGAAVLVQSPCGTAVLIDGGGEPPYKGHPGLTGERVLLPFLRRQRIRYLDMVVITHAHEDHFGGVLHLIDNIAIERMLVSPMPGSSVYYDDLLEMAREAGIDVLEARQGELWQSGSGSISFEILWPREQLLQSTVCDLNNNSLVLRFGYDRVNFLLTGDIQDAAVEAMLRQGLDMEADILQVPHHGGYMSLMPEFVAVVEPYAAIVPVGPNPFGHPHPFIIESLEEAGVPIYRTDKHGAVIVETCGESIWINTMQSIGNPPAPLYIF